MLGMHGTPQANLAISGADVILALGTRFSDRSTGNRETFAPGAKIIHVDIDRAEFGKNVPPHTTLLGDAGKVLAELNERLSAPVGNADWLQKIEGWKEKYFPPRDGSRHLDARGIIELVRAKSSQGTVVTTEVGQNQMWSALFWKTDRPGKFISSGGLGTMGFGLPSALGASFATDGDPVFCIAGDGSLLMNIQEMETCARYNLPVKIIILNNGTLGMVKQWQELFFQERYAETCHAPVCDFAALARAFGAEGYRVNDLDELGSVLDEIMKKPGPAVVDCPIRPEELVFPMVPAGGKISEFLTEEDR
jgi:acetolactate synthase-1/2/3 large subunit